MVLQRLAVFIDYQNVYKGARQAAGGMDGVDVALAVGLLVEAPNYDVAILFSGDADLLPAVEHVVINLGKTVESAAWIGGARQIPRDKHLTCSND